MVPSAGDVRGNVKPLLSSPTVRVDSPRSMLTDGVRTFEPRSRGLRGDFGGGGVDVGGLEDTLGVRGGGGLGDGRCGESALPLIV